MESACLRHWKSFASFITPSLPVKTLLVDSFWVVAIRWRNCCWIISFEEVAKWVFRLFLFGGVVFRTIVQGITGIDFIWILLVFVNREGKMRLFKLNDPILTWVLLLSTTLYLSGDGYCRWYFSKKASRSSSFPEDHCGGLVLSNLLGSCAPGPGEHLSP